MFITVMSSKQKRLRVIMGWVIVTISISERIFQVAILVKLKIYLNVSINNSTNCYIAKKNTAWSG